MLHRNVKMLLLLMGSLAVAYPQAKPKIEKKEITYTAPTGPEMFRAYCAACHGPNATGNGPAAPALKKEPANLTQLSKKNGGKFPGVHVRLVIEGSPEIPAHGSRDMPMWGQLFKEMEGPSHAMLRVAILVDYLEKLQEK